MYAVEKCKLSRFFSQGIHYILGMVVSDYQGGEIYWLFSQT